MIPNGTLVTKDFIYSISPRNELGHRVIVKLEKKTKQVIEARINKLDMSVNKICKKITYDAKWFERLPILEGSTDVRSEFI